MFPSLTRILISCYGIALGALPIYVSGGFTDVSAVTPNRFIVEIESASTIQLKRSPHELLYSSLRNRDIRFQVDKEYNSEGLFVGAALTLNNAQDVAALLQTEGTKAVRPIQTYKRPEPVQMLAISNNSFPPDMESAHSMTGVDRLHAEGITGAGVSVGIIDTGIDYTHPALGGGFGAGYKVAGGYDFVGDNFTGTNTPVPDPDPLDQCYGHGTHVAGILAADPSNPYNISGVAYSVSIFAYRVFGCSGTTTDDIIVEALLRGVQDKQDILTMSIGGDSGWTEGTASVVASRIASTGKIVTIAAGDDGASGSWYSSSPGNAIDAISVASVDNIDLYLNNATVQGAVHNTITYYSFAVFPFPGPFPIYATSNDTTVVDDACNPLPDDTPDLSPYLVIIRRGTCTFVQKLTNAAAKGALVVLIYDNGTGFGLISTGNFTNVTLIQADDGEFLVNEFAIGTPITVSFPQDGSGSTQYPNNATGGLVSSFSSYGPTNDFYFKPSIAAPGGDIMSTLPTTRGYYGMASGTSMACPYIAGSSALLLSVKGASMSAKAVRNLLETTAQVVPSSFTEGDPLQTVSQQGAGLVNVYDAMYATTLVSPAALLLNDTAHFQGNQTFTVQNTGNTTKDYSFNHLPAGTAITIQPGTAIPASGPVPLNTSYADVDFSPSSFTLSPGETQTVFAQFTPPIEVDNTTLPVYSGFIQIIGGSKNGANDTTHVTYMGVAGSLIDQPVLDTTNVTLGIPLPAIIANGSLSAVQTEANNYSFVGSDYPTVLYRLVFGTSLLRIDLVPGDFALHLNQTLNARTDPSISIAQHISTGSFLDVPSIGVLFEEDYVSRNDNVTNSYYTSNFTSPTFANGTRVPNGTYKFMMRALRVTGDPTNGDDYDVYLSPPVGYNIIPA